MHQISESFLWQRETHIPWEGGCMYPIQEIPSLGKLKPNPKTKYDRDRISITLPQCQCKCHPKLLKIKTWCTPKGNSFTFFVLITYETFLKKRPLASPVASKTYGYPTPPARTSWQVIQGHSPLSPWQTMQFINSINHITIGSKIIEMLPNKQVIRK